jgi:hypothetical protein
MLKLSGAAPGSSTSCVSWLTQQCAGYLLGEFGHLLQTGPSEYFALLQQRFAACGLPTKALLLSAYAKVRSSLAHSQQCICTAYP